MAHCLWFSYWTELSPAFRLRDSQFLNSRLVGEPPYDIPSFYFLYFLRSIHPYELTNRHEPTTHSHEQLVSFLNLNINPLAAEPVNPLRLPKEQDIEVFSLRESINIVTKSSINTTCSPCNINSSSQLSDLSDEFVMRCIIRSDPCLVCFHLLNKFVLDLL